MATLAALVALPATASAQSSHHASTSVKSHVSKAKKSLKKFHLAVAAHDDSLALADLNSARRHTAAAAKLARSLASHASTDAQQVSAASALTLAGGQYDSLVEQITALVDEVTGQVQAIVAQSIPSALAGKQKVIQILTELLPKLPAAAQGPLASIITALSVGDDTEVTNMQGALDGGTLPVNISGLISQSLGMATAAIQTAFDTIKGIIPLLPSVVQGPLSTILDLVSNTVGTIIPTVLNMATGLIGQILGSLPFIGSGANGGLGNLLGGILGGSSTPGTGAGIPNISGLLGNLFPSGGSGGGGPVAGIGGIVSSITGLITNLLGGLLPH